MKTTLWSEIDRYYLDLFVQYDPRMRSAMANPDFPGLRLAPMQGRFLEILLRTIRPALVLEIGTLGGYSTAWLASGLSKGARLISLEIDPARAELARRNLAPFEFQAQVEIREGDALKVMAGMVADGHPAFDLIFIDGEKSQYPGYLDLSLQLSRPGSLIIADNVVKHGHIFNEAIDTPSRKGITEFHRQAAADPRLEGAVLQTVGEKGHDGIAFLWVKSADLPEPGAEFDT